MKASNRPTQLRALFRCDGIDETGLGHVSRCLALGEALRDLACESLFLGTFESAAVQMIVAAGFRLQSMRRPRGSREDAAATISSSRLFEAAMIVVDSYVIDDGFVGLLRAAEIAVVLVDDFALLGRYDCTAVINFTVRAEGLKYPKDGQLYLLGPKYLLVRSPLRVQRRQIMRRFDRDLRRVLITMGGSDRIDLTLRILGALGAMRPDVAVEVVVGRSHPTDDRVQNMLSRFHGDCNIATQPSDLAAVLTRADVAICGGGLTKYESAYLGLPSAVLSVNDGQAQDTLAFAANHLCVNLGLAGTVDDRTLCQRLDPLLRNAALRRSLSRSGLQFFPIDPTIAVAEELVRLVSSTNGNRAP